MNRFSTVMVTGHMEDGKFHPHSNSSGISESSFSDVKDILGNPRRDKFGGAGIPMSEKKAQFKKIGGYAKGLHERMTAANASGKARDLEKKKTKERQAREADKNLKIASQFIMNAERLQQGKAPEKIDINIEDDSSHGKLPQHMTPEQIKQKEKKQEEQAKSEKKVIEKIAKQSQTVEPEIPIMPEGPPSYSSQESEPEYTPEPQSRSSSNKSADQLALEAYPVSP